MNVMDRKRKTRLNELKNLSVDRIDGVDKPTTGRKFLLFKSEGQNVAAALANARTEKQNAEIGRLLKAAPKSKAARLALRKMGVKVLKSGRVEKAPIPSRRHVSFASILPVRKAIESYDLADLGQETEEVDTDAMNADEDSFWSSLTSANGRVSQTETIDVPGRKPYARDSFLDPTGEFGQALVHGYRMQEGAFPDALQSTPGFPGRGIPGGLVEPADFSAPKPKAVRMGDGTVLKRGNPVGFWSSVLGPEAVPSLESIERSMKATPELFTKEEHAALAKRLAKEEGGPGFAHARQFGDEWLRGE